LQRLACAFAGIHAGECPVIQTSGVLRFKRGVHHQNKKQAGNFLHVADFLKT
jgi:hypothetical protein